jgi:hypothetical protein
LKGGMGDKEKSVGNNMLVWDLPCQRLEHVHSYLCSKVNSVRDEDPSEVRSLLLFLSKSFSDQRSIFNRIELDFDQRNNLFICITGFANLSKSIKEFQEIIKLIGKFLIILVSLNFFNLLVFNCIIVSYTLDV